MDREQLFVLFLLVVVLMAGMFAAMKAVGEGAVTYINHHEDREVEAVKPIDGQYALLRTEVIILDPALPFLAGMFAIIWAVLLVGSKLDWWPDKYDAGICIPAFMFFGIILGLMTMRMMCGQWSWQDYRLYAIFSLAAGIPFWWIVPKKDGIKTIFHWRKIGLAFFSIAASYLPFVGIFLIAD